MAKSKIFPKLNKALTKTRSPRSVHTPRAAAQSGSDGGGRARRFLQGRSGITGNAGHHIALHSIPSSTRTSKLDRFSHVNGERGWLVALGSAPQLAIGTARQEPRGWRCACCTWRRSRRGELDEMEVSPAPWCPPCPVWWWWWWTGGCHCRLPRHGWFVVSLAACLVASGR